MVCKSPSLRGSPKPEFAKLISVWSKMRLTAASTLSAGMPKPINKEMWKSRALLKCCLLQGLHSPKLEARVLFFQHLPDRSTCPVSGILLSGMLMEFYLLLVGWRNKTKPGIILRAATQDNIFPIGQDKLLTSALLWPMWLLYFLLTLPQLPKKPIKCSYFP